MTVKYNFNNKIIFRPALSLHGYYCVHQRSLGRLLNLIVTNFNFVSLFPMNTLRLRNVTLDQDLLRKSKKLNKLLSLKLAAKKNYLRVGPT